MTEAPLSVDEVRGIWPILSTNERVEAFQHVERAESATFFLGLSAHEQVEILLSLPRGERRLRFRLLPPDATADLVQHAPDDERER